MDTSLFLWLNSFIGGGGLGDALVRFLASDLQYLLGVAFVVAVLWPARRYRMAIAALVSAAIARLALKPLIVALIARPRPYVALVNVHNIIGPQTGEEYQSFPSGHALFFFALAMAAYLYDRRLGWWFFAGATLMGIARVTGGIHWPSDILGGAIIGILTAWLLVRLIPALHPHTMEVNA